MGYKTGREAEQMIGLACGGYYRKVAVGCWFTVSGRAIPKLIRYEDEEGCLKLVRDIFLIKEESRNYGGILSRSYRCRALVDQQLCEFTLLYHPRENYWDMIMDR